MKDLMFGILGLLVFVTALTADAKEQARKERGARK